MVPLIRLDSTNFSQWPTSQQKTLRAIFYEDSQKSFEISPELIQLSPVLKELIENKKDFILLEECDSKILDILNQYSQGLSIHNFEEGNLLQMLKVAIFLKIDLLIKDFDEAIKTLNEKKMSTLLQIYKISIDHNLSSLKEECMKHMSIKLCEASPRMKPWFDYPQYSSNLEELLKSKQPLTKFYVRLKNFFSETNVEMVLTRNKDIAIQHVIFQWEGGNDELNKWDKLWDPLKQIPLGSLEIIYSDPIKADPDLLAKKRWVENLSYCHLNTIKIDGKILKAPFTIEDLKEFLKK